MDKGYKDLVVRGLLNPPPPDNGKFQFGVFVQKDVCALRELFCEGDDVRVTPGGALEILRKPIKKSLLQRALAILRGDHDGRCRVNLVLPPGRWLACYLTSPIDGCPVAVHDWEEIGMNIEDWIQRGGR